MPTLPTYDSQKVLATSLSTSQLGTSGSGVDWADDSSPSLTLTTDVGLSFDFSVNNDSERGLVLAPRIPFTTATSDPAGTGETATTWTLTISTSLTSIPAAAFIRVFVQLAPAPSVWSGSTNTPTLNIADTDSVFILETVTAASDAWTLNGSTYDLVWSLDFTTDYVRGDGGETTSFFQKLVNSPTWNGLIQVNLDQFLLNFTTPITGATFAGNVHRWHTGATDFPLNRRGRVVHDYITGQPYLSDEAVADGYRDGIMVHPDNFDPDDPLEENPWTPPPHEGVVDDTVIDLE